jgi:FixJ family two-component response regulator
MENDLSCLQTARSLSDLLFLGTVQMAERRLVSVVDDDESVRESLPDLLRSFGFEVQAFASAEAFLGSGSIPLTGCLIVDVAMPRMTGPELRQELARRGYIIPAVYITAQSAEQVRPFVSKNGAVAWLFKPFTETEILEAVSAALGRA